MKLAQELRFINTKKSLQYECEDQENIDPNLPLRGYKQAPSTAKKNSSSGSRHPWSSSNEHNFSNTHDDVETSCFNIGPQKVTSLSHSQMMSAQHQLDQYIGARNVQDALIYVEEFDDIDWVRNQQIILLLDIISRGPYEQIQVHTIDVAKLINSKKYLLSKLVVKGLYNNAFISNPSFGMAIDSILQEQMEQQGELFQHQSNYASLSLYTHAHLLLQTESIHECWELVRGRLDIQGQRQSDDLEKTIQKICELLLRYCIEKQNHQDLFNQILSIGVRALSSRPNDIFFNKLIDYAFKNKQVQMAEQLFTFMTQELGINPTIVTINTLIDQYFKNHQQERAWEVFNSLKTRYTSISADNFTYTTLINGLKSGREGIMDLKRAFDLFAEYKQNSQPDQIIYNCLLDACINAGDLTRAYQLLQEMKQTESIHLDEITYNTLIKGCGRKKRLNDAIALFEEMKTMNISPNRISFNSLLDSCVKCNRMNIAWRYYEEMTKEFGIVPDNFTYSILINGIKTNHSNRDELLKAILLLEEIQEDGQFKADEILYNSLIDACVKFNDIQRSLALFNEMKRKGVEPSSVTYGILIKAYGKQNDLSKAFGIFKEMKSNGVPVNDVTYGCLVDACVKNDRLDMALELSEQMKTAGVPLNTVLFTTLIKGFARAGRIDEALSSFATMKMNTRTYPNLITYNSLLDGLVKHHKFSEAEQLFDEMLQSQHTLPDLISFSTLLKGHCKVHDIRKLKELVEHMVRLGVQPDESLLMLVMDVCFNQQHYALGLSVFHQFCTQVPQTLPLLLGALRLNVHCNSLDAARSLLIRLLSLLDDVTRPNHNRPLLERTLSLISSNAASAPDLIPLISEIILKAHRKHQVQISDVRALIIAPNETMIVELLVLPNIPIDLLQALQLSTQAQKLVNGYISRFQIKNRDSTLGEKFGNIVKSCLDTYENEPVLREISNLKKINIVDQKGGKFMNNNTKGPQQQDENNNGNMQQTYNNQNNNTNRQNNQNYISNRQNNQNYITNSQNNQNNTNIQNNNQNQKNNNSYNNNQNYHKCNNNQSNSYSNSNNSQTNYNRKPIEDSNDLDDFIPKKSQWRPVKRY